MNYNNKDLKDLKYIIKNYNLQSQSLKPNRVITTVFATTKSTRAGCLSHFWAHTHTQNIIVGRVPVTFLSSHTHTKHHHSIDRCHPSNPTLSSSQHQRNGYPSDPIKCPECMAARVCTAVPPTGITTNALFIYKR